MKVLLHGHHNRLISWGITYEERAQEIRKKKPENEIEPRLKLMRELTEEEVAELPPDYREAGLAFVQAREESLERAFARFPRLFWGGYCYYEELKSWHHKHCHVQDCPWNGGRLVGIGSWK